MSTTVDEIDIFGAHALVNPLDCMEVYKQKCLMLSTFSPSKINLSVR
jgi:hypothetical protein